MKPEENSKNATSRSTPQMPLDTFSNEDTSIFPSTPTSLFVTFDEVGNFAFTLAEETSILDAINATAGASTALLKIAEKDFSGYDDQLILWFGTCNAFMKEQLTKQIIKLHSVLTDKVQNVKFINTSPPRFVPEMHKANNFWWMRAKKLRPVSTFKHGDTGISALPEPFHAPAASQVPPQNISSHFDWAMPASASVSKNVSANYEIYIAGGMISSAITETSNMIEFLYAKLAELVLKTEDQEIASGEGFVSVPPVSFGSHDYGMANYDSGYCQHLASKEPLLAINNSANWGKFITHIHRKVEGHEMHHIQAYNANRIKRLKH